VAMVRSTASQTENASSILVARSPRADSLLHGAV